MILYKCGLQVATYKNYELQIVIPLPKKYFTGGHICSELKSGEIKNKFVLI